MENNNVSLSQAEVDRLLGISSLSENKGAEKVKVEYTHEIIASQDELDSIQKKYQSQMEYFKNELDCKFSAAKMRKINVSKVDQISVDEFLDSVTGNDFLFYLDFGAAGVYIKLDSFLYCALSGLAFDTRITTNLFQSEVLKNFVIPIFLDMIFKVCSKTLEPEISSLYKADLSELKNGSTGICLTMNWNENFKSFGIEKLFFTKEMKSILEA